MVKLFHHVLFSRVLEQANDQEIRDGKVFILLGIHVLASRKTIVEKQLYAGKVPSFPTFVTIIGNILGFLYKKSNVGIRPSSSAHKYLQKC